MKAQLIYLFILLCSGCMYNEIPELNSNRIYGRWKLIEANIDPGDGSGTWRPGWGEVISFYPNNIFKAEERSLLWGIRTFKVSSDTTIDVEGEYADNLVSYQLRYKLNRGILELHPPCYEGCGMRFTKLAELEKSF
ncbi:MAG: hypothetical protein K2U26_02425 [Cyclobacteriaceae bacterium]|nr:hypothetical protein [Cyclobacteriaceae bacterium]